MISTAQLVTTNTGRTTFDKAAVMARAHREGRFALRMCRPLAIAA